MLQDPQTISTRTSDIKKACHTWHFNGLGVHFEITLEWKRLHSHVLLNFWISPRKNTWALMRNTYLVTTLQGPYHSYHQGWSAPLSFRCVISHSYHPIFYPSKPLGSRRRGKSRAQDSTPRFQRATSSVVRFALCGPSHTPHNARARASGKNDTNSFTLKTTQHQRIYYCTHQYC